MKKEKRKKKKTSRKVVLPKVTLFSQLFFFFFFLQRKEKETLLNIYLLVTQLVSCICNVFMHIKKKKKKKNSYGVAKGRVGEGVGAEGRKRTTKIRRIKKNKKLMNKKKGKA